MSYFKIRLFPVTFSCVFVIFKWLIGREGIVAQLVEQSLPIPVVCGSNPVMGKICIKHLFNVNWIEKTKIKKKRPGMSIFLKNRHENNSVNIGPWATDKKCRLGSERKITKLIASFQATLTESVNCSKRTRSWFTRSRLLSLTRRERSRTWRACTTSRWRTWRPPSTRWTSSTISSRLEPKDFCKKMKNSRASELIFFLTSSL